MGVEENGGNNLGKEEGNERIAIFVSLCHCLWYDVRLSTATEATTSQELASQANYTAQPSANSKPLVNTLDYIVAVEAKTVDI